MPTLGTLVYLLNYFGGGEKYGIQEEDKIGLIVMAGVLFIWMILLTFLFYKIKLTTKINSDGIYVKYPPMFFKEKFISKEEVERFEVRTFKPLSEYGGHGVKKGKKSGKCYTISGKTGLQLYLTTKERILIGTKRHEAIKYAMNKMMDSI